MRPCGNMEKWKGSMKILYFDCFSGISGDMTLAASSIWAFPIDTGGRAQKAGPGKLLSRNPFREPERNRGAGPGGSGGTARGTPPPFLRHSIDDQE